MTQDIELVLRQSASVEKEYDYPPAPPGSVSSDSDDELRTAIIGTPQVSASASHSSHLKSVHDLNAYTPGGMDDITRQMMHGDSSFLIGDALRRSGRDRKPVQRLAVETSEENRKRDRARSVGYEGSGYKKSRHQQGDDDADGYEYVYSMNMPTHTRSGRSVRRPQDVYRVSPDSSAGPPHTGTHLRISPRFVRNGHHEERNGNSHKNFVSMHSRTSPRFQRGSHVTESNGTSSHAQAHPAWNPPPSGRRTRNSLSTLEADALAELVSKAPAASITQQTDEIELEGHLSASKSSVSQSREIDKPFVRTPRRNVLVKDSEPEDSDADPEASPNRASADGNEAEEEEVASDNVMSTPYNLRNRNNAGNAPNPRKRKRNRDPDASGRPKRTQPPPNYDEKRLWKAVFGGIDHDRRRPSERRSAPMASTVGGGVSYVSDDEEDTLARPLLQYTRCASLLERFDPSEKPLLQARLQSHLQSNDFPGTPQITERVTFDMIGGHDDHVKMIHEMIKISLLYPEAAKQAESIKGLLFYGPPGNGKTLMARAIASTYSTATNPVSFFPIHASEIHSKWFGDSEKHLRKLFQDAKAAQPSIIFFDEIDGVVPSRASGESSAPHNSVVTALLTLMDGLESRGRVIVIGATNRLDTLDPALLRPGRFDRQLRFNPPNRIARRKIIDIKTHEYGLDDSIKDEMALVTEGFSGADLKALCADAWYKALRRTWPQVYERAERLQVDFTKVKVTRGDFVRSLRELKPSGILASADYLPPSSLHTLSLLSAPLRALTPTLDMITNVLSRKTLHQPTLSPRILLHGIKGMGQQQLAVAVSGRLREEGFHVEAVRKADEIEEMASRLSDRGVMVVLGMEKWDAESVTRLEDALDARSRAVVVIGTVELLSADSRVEAMPVYEAFMKNDMSGILGYRQSVAMVDAPEDARREFFTPIVDGINRQRDPAETEIPPTALMEVDVAPTMSLPELTAQERKEIDAKISRLFHDLKTKLRAFHKDIAKQKYRLFCHPVDAEKNPDYYDRIRNPMDMGTIQSKIDDDCYLTPEHWLADVELIWRNSEAYNGRGEVTSRAAELRDDARSWVEGLSRGLKANWWVASIWKRWCELEDRQVDDRCRPCSDNNEHTASERGSSKPKDVQEGDAVMSADGSSPTTGREAENDLPATLTLKQDASNLFVSDPEAESMDISKDAVPNVPNGTMENSIILAPDEDRSILLARILEITRKTTVSDMEVLYHIMEGVLEDSEGETDRNIVLAKIQAIVERVGAQVGAL